MAPETGPVSAVVTDGLESGGRLACARVERRVYVDEVEGVARKLWEQRGVVAFEDEVVVDGDHVVDDAIAAPSRAATASGSCVSWRHVMRMTR